MALTSAGFAASLSMLNNGIYVTAPNKQPAMMIHLRPILSDSEPKTMKKGVPINNETATKILAVAPSTFKACVKKNRA